MDKFRLNDGERLFMEGYTVYLKNKINIIIGDAYITSERFVFCKKSTLIYYFLLGPIFGHLVKGKNIVFEFPVTDFKSIHEEKHGFAKKCILSLKRGDEYSIQFGTKRDKWIAAIRDTVKSVVPDVQISEIGERIDFHG